MNLAATGGVAVRSERLGGIEVCRGAAATLVVLCHVARHLDKAGGAPMLQAVLASGHAGVDFFFVISGFIILFVHHADVANASLLARYAARRTTRLLPTYWVALALTLALAIAGGHAPPPLADLVWSVSLLPSDRPMLLGIAWTLQFEVLFYILFAVLIVSRGVGVTALAAWLAVACLSAVTGWRAGWLPHQFVEPYAFEFFLGMAAAHLLKRLTIPCPRAVMVIGVALFAVALAAEDAGLLDGYGGVARLAYGVPAALAVLGIAEADRRGRLRVPAALSALGGASYSIYLFQFVFIGSVWQILRATRLDRTMPAGVMFIVLSLAAIGGGVAMSGMVERPLLRLLRRPWRVRPTAG